MPALPQNDPSSTRAQELAERRARYVWDHAYLPPFPFLQIPDIDKTGVLHLVDILAGTYLGMPVEEQPSIEFAVRKLEVALPPIYELMCRVPLTEWAKVAVALKATLGRRIDDWTRDAIDLLLEDIEKTDEGSMGVLLPEADDLIAVAMDVGLKAAVELGSAVDENRSILGRLITVVESVFGGGDAKEDIESSREAAARAQELGLPIELIQAIVPLQALLRFIATMHTHGVITPGTTPNITTWSTTSSPPTCPTPPRTTRSSAPGTWPAPTRCC